MEFLKLKIPPALVFALFAGAMWILASHCPAAALPVPWRLPLAALLSATGLMAGAAGVLAFLRARTTVHPGRPEHASALVTTGIYRFTRNPMYLGLLLMLAGWALALANGWAMLLLPVFVAYMNRFQIRPEEDALRKKFGAAFDAYAGSVRRCL